MIFSNPQWMTPDWVADEEPQAGAQTRLLRILRWRLGGTRAEWPRWIIDPTPTGDPRAVPAPGTISVTFIGHSSFLIRIGTVVMLTDPIFSPRASPVTWAGPKRVRAPGRGLDGLPPIDLVLLSHNHYDHLDLPSLRALHRHSRPRVVTPLGNAVHVRKSGDFAVDELDWWQQTTIGAARITAVPARHFSSRTLRDSGRALWAGFMVECAEWRVLFAGDSGNGAHWTRIRDRLGTPDLAFLPIGAYQPRALMRRVHMDPAEAVAAHRALGSRQSIGMHFGTFQLTDEPIAEPEHRLAEECRRQRVAEAGFVTLGFGECRAFERNLAA